MAKKKVVSKSSTVYVFKVALKRNQKVWRRIAIRGDQTLDELHWAIFHAFDRDDEHLYSFFIGAPGKRDRSRFGGVEYCDPFSATDEWSESEGQDASQTTIESLALRKGKKFEYLFDWGDQWWHTLTLEKIEPYVDTDKDEYPRILEVHGKSPPQYEFDEDEDWDEDEEDEEGA